MNSIHEQFYHNFDENLPIMTNLLYQYFVERYKDTDQLINEPGPVITISREYGCQAKQVAQGLLESLNNYGKLKGQRKPWAIVSKEILEESAKTLEVNKSEIEYIFNFETKSTIDEILSSFSSKFYKSDRHVRKTIKDVIRSIAAEGNVIIVGRCGFCITRDIPKSLHIRLVAPLKWRIGKVSSKYNLTLEKAQKEILEMDHKRKYFINSIAGRKIEDSEYDLTINVSSLNVDEIVSIISKISDLKGFI